MDAGRNNVSPMRWGFLVLVIKYKTSKEARNTFVMVVSVVRIKFDCYPISDSFLKITVMVYKQEILDKLSAYANFLL
jgi:hypothetical protein